MSQIITNIKYLSDGSSPFWHIPFPFGDASQVGVRLMGKDGLERELVYNSDYAIANSNVVCVVPAGQTLIIWLKTSISEARASNDAALVGSLASGPVYAASLATAASAASAAAPVALALETESQEIASASREALNEIEAASDEAINQLMEAIDDAVPQVQTLIARVEALLEEAGTLAANARSDAAQAQAYSSQAQGYMATAAQSAQSASVMAENICTCNDGVAQCSDMARAYANASQKSAADAYQADINAWRAACAASMHHCRPGFCAVRRLEDIWACTPGLYLVNPHLVPAPTPFMGIWPAADTAAMQWDGVFFIGPEYPAELTLPPKCVIPEQPVPEFNFNSGSADDWIPCGHNHKAACCCKG